jgi:hypothetical protein
MNRNTLLLLAVFAVGCAAGMHVDSRAQAQSLPTPARIQKWQQECVDYGASPKTANRLLRERGAQGWELVGLSSWSSFSGTDYVACFKRPVD